MNENDLDDLRSAAIRAESTAGEESLGGIWQDLVEGRQRVTDAFFTPARCFLLLTPTHGTICAISGRRRHVLEALLNGQTAKALAYDLTVAPSTISQDAKLALSHIGCGRTAGRVHPLLVIAARAASRGAASGLGRGCWFTHAGEHHRVVGAPRPDERLGPVLPPAELAVVRGLVEGRNYREIAASRGTSTRTVANQLAAAFRRLGVSGRGNLLGHLAQNS